MRSFPPDLDTAIRTWFTDHGLDVHETYYQFDYSFYAWRFYGEKRMFTLWVSQLTAEDYGVKAIMHILENIDPNGLMDEYRHVHAHVASNDTEFGVHVRSTFSPTASAE